jgi:glutathione S-transferase
MNGAVMNIKLWGRPTSARTQKVMLALAELNLKHEYILASSTMGPTGAVAKGGSPFGVVTTPEYLAMNPTGTIPMLEDNGYILWESNAIVQYLGMKYNPTQFYNNDIETCNSAMRWMMWENNQLISPMHDLVVQLYRIPNKLRDNRLILKCKQKLIKEFKVIDAELGKTEYMTGDSWSMADIPITIRCHRFYLMEFLKPEMPNITRYYKNVKRRASFKSIEDPNYHING